MNLRSTLSSYNLLNLSNETNEPLVIGTEVLIGCPNTNKPEEKWTGFSSNGLTYLNIYE